MLNTVYMEAAIVIWIRREGRGVGKGLWGLLEGILCEAALRTHSR